MKKTDVEFDAGRIERAMEDVAEFLRGNRSGKVRRYYIPAPPPAVSGDEIKEIRTNMGVTQPVFARILGVSTETAKSWETGRRSPNATARRLLQIAAKEPAILFTQK